MKSPGSLVLTCLIALVIISAAAPLLISLSHALLPLVIVLAVAIVAVRLAFFHTRRW
jgi:hypothetical protein